MYCVSSGASGMHTGALRTAIAAVILAGGTGAYAADMATKAPPAIAAPVPYVDYWAGLDARTDSVYGYGGGVFALGGNLNQNGWLFRVSGGDGEYRYNRAVGFSQHVDFQNGDAMIGYQTFIGQSRFTGYLGAYIQNDDNPDPAAKVSGTRAGVKVQGEAYIPFNPSWYGFGLASYASAWNNYDLLGRLGYQLSPIVSVGPEGMAIGNDRYGEARGGGFVSFNITPTAQLILSGGYSWDTRTDALNDHSGGYGTVHVRAEF